MNQDSAANPPRPADAPPVLVLAVRDEVPPPVAPVPRRARGTKWREDELLFFLNIMNDVLPIGPTEWEEVLDAHSVRFPGRDVNGLRRKYTTLHRKKIPTGDPHMPEPVRMAKLCKYRTADKADLGDGTGHFDMMMENGLADDDPEGGVPNDDPCDVLPPPPVLPETAAVAVASVPQPPPSLRSLTSTSTLGSRTVISPRKSKSGEKQDFSPLWLSRCRMKVHKGLMRPVNSRPQEPRGLL